MVAEYIDEYINKSKTKLISDAESMTYSSLKSMNNYPKYIIIREVDD